MGWSDPCPDSSGTRSETQAYPTQLARPPACRISPAILYADLHSWCCHCLWRETGMGTVVICAGRDFVGASNRAQCTAHDEKRTRQARRDSTPAARDHRRKSNRKSVQYGTLGDDAISRSFATTFSGQLAIGERAGDHVDLVGHRIGLVRERRSARAAEAATHALGRRVVAGERRGEAEGGAWDRDPRRHRRRGRTTAGLAVAVERPVRLGVVGELARSAEAVSRGHAAFSARRPGSATLVPLSDRGHFRCVSA